MFRGRVVEFPSEFDPQAIPEVFDLFVLVPDFFTERAESVHSFHSGLTLLFYALLGEKSTASGHGIFFRWTCL